MVTRQVEQAKISGMRFMEQNDKVESNMNSSGLAVETHTVNRHHQRADNPYDSQSRDHGRRFRRQFKSPQRQKHAQQSADAHENDVETFE